MVLALWRASHSSDRSPKARHGLAVPVEPLDPAVVAVADQYTAGGIKRDTG